MPTSLPDWPTTKDEAYRYTSLTALTEQTYKPAQTALRTSPLSPNTTLRDGAELPAHFPQDAVVRRALAVEDKGWTIDVAGHNSAPLMLDYTTPENTTTAPRLVLRLAPESSLTFVEHVFLDDEGLRNNLVSIELGEGAKLTHIRLQEGGAHAFQLSTTAVTLAKDAAYRSTCLSMGGALSRHALHMTLQGEGATARLAAINLLSGNQHGDLTTFVRHLKGHATSDQLVRNVLTDAAQGVFQGQIHVAPGAQKTQAQQHSRSLLLGEDAAMNTKPELEIYADDVVCGHGAALGNLDPLALFYLRARGLPEAQARAMLVRGFISEALEELGTPELRSRLDGAIDHWMGAHT